MAPIDPWIDRLNASLRRYAIPLVFGDRPHRRDPTHVNLASGVAVDLGQGPFLVTASHVISRAQERQGEPRFHFLAGPAEIELSRIISDRRKLDVATLRLTEREVADIERDGYQIVRPRPADWPPPDLSHGDPIVMAGFPVEWRSSLSWFELDLGAQTMRAFAHAVGEDQFTTYLDPEFTVRNEVDVSAPDRPAAFEGLSGGPAFVTPSEGMLLVPHLCGIVKEGGVSSLVPGRLVIHYARIHRLQQNGAMG